MGNTAFRDLADIEEIELDDLQGSLVAVDASNWLYKYLYNVVKFNQKSLYTTTDGERRPNLVGTIVGLNKFFENNITPVFVFDGAPHKLKAKEIAQRRGKRDEAAKEQKQARKDGDLIAASNYEARSIHLDSGIIDTTKELLELLDIPYVTAPQAAEAYAAQLTTAGYTQSVVSDDYDTIMFGAPRTVRNFTSSTRPLELIDFEKTLSKHEITHRQLIEVALLCGTDYNDGVYGIGPKTGVKYIKEHETLEQVLEEKEETIENYETVRGIFFSEAAEKVDELKIDTTISPDFEAAYEYLFDENGLHSKKLDSAFDKLKTFFEQPSLDMWA